MRWQFYAVCVNNRGICLSLQLISHMQSSRSGSSHLDLHLFPKNCCSHQILYYILYTLYWQYVIPSILYIFNIFVYVSLYGCCAGITDLCPGEDGFPLNSDASQRFRLRCCVMTVVVVVSFDCSLIVLIQHHNNIIWKDSKMISAHTVDLLAKWLSSWLYLSMSKGNIKKYTSLACVLISV